MRSHRRGALIILLTLCVGAGGMATAYLHDSEPPALSGLEPPEMTRKWRGETDTNGWAWLRSKLDKWHSKDPRRHGRFSTKVAGLSDTEALRLAQEGGLLFQWLEEALQKPDFFVCKGDFYDELHSWKWNDFAEALRADFTVSLSAGNRTRALSIALGVERLSTLFFRDTVRTAEFWLAARLRGVAIQCALDLMASGPDDKELHALFVPLWKADPFPAALVAKVLAAHALQDPEEFMMQRGGLAGFPQWKHQCFYKPNKTRRILLGEAWALLNHPLRPVGTLQESPGERAVERHTPAHRWMYELHPNSFALMEMLPGWAHEYRLHEARTARGALFSSRAMRVALAVRGWRFDHPGAALPATLRELVPAHLDEVPVDPWNGAPLGWHAGPGSVTGVGTDWRPAPPNPAMKPGSLDQDSDRTDPELRLPIPP